MRKFKILFIAIFMIGVLATSTLLCACDGDDSNDQTDIIRPIVEQRYDDVNITIYREHSLTLKGDCSTTIKTVEELNTFCDQNTSPVFDKENKITKGQNQRAINAFKQYDAKFFKKKSLAVLFRAKGSSGYFYDFKDYNINDSQLDVTLSMTIPKEGVDYTCDMAIFIYVLELDKSKLANVTQINVEEIQQRKDFEFKYYSFAYCRNYATILKSIEDLSNFDDEYGFQNHVDAEYSEKIANKRKELLAQYDEEFFQDKSLVVIFRYRPCLGLKSDIKFCDIEGNTMNVTVAKISENHSLYATAIEMHLCLLEFDKTIVENVTQINVEEVDEILPCKDPNCSLW